MGFYEFNKDDAFRFAHFINARTKLKGNNLIFSRCPYCNSNKDKETFAIDMRTGQFNCLRASCGVKGNMLTLSKDFNFSISEDVDRYLNRNYSNNRFKTWNKVEYRAADAVIKYMGHRGISENICRKYKLTEKKGKDNKGIMVFPFEDPEGNLKFIKYRNMNFVKGETKGSKEWCEQNCMPILFGMAQCEDFGRLIITEGQIDSLSCSEAGLKNACSVPTGALGTTWIPHCYDWVQKFKEIVVFGDNEKGHITLVDMIQNRFPHSMVKIVKSEDYLGEKDANDILLHHGKDALINAVNNAEAVLNKQVRNAAEIERVNLDDIPKIKTGFKQLDKTLKGGFMYGQVILVTGKRGAGKSTLCSQFVCDALSQDQNCFIYSGELPDFWVKDWLDRQLSGKEHPTNSEIEECEAFYNDRLFIFNNQLVETDELDDLLTVLKDTIIKRDIKLALLDNLMTAISSETSENLYRKQSEFVGNLAKIAKAFNMVILLVAHPRKSNADFDNDEVSGSADITNRVDVVMSYDRDKNRNQNDLRVLKITKNRMTGYLGDMDLYFSDFSKRISDTPNEFTKFYLKSEFMPVTDEMMEVIPF